MRVLPRNVFPEGYDNPQLMLPWRGKDIALANELGREYNVPMSIANLVNKSLSRVEPWWGDKDSSGTFLIQEEAAGIEVRSPNVDYVKAGKLSLHT